MKIKSMISADNWFAVYQKPGMTDEVRQIDLVCWALIPGNDDEESVVGMVPNADGDVVTAKSLKLENGETFKSYGLYKFVQDDDFGFEFEVDGSDDEGPLN